jgi:AAA15 family ATPase/GTPase
MSFNEREEFSMAATKVSRHESHTMPIGKKRVLKGSFIYGANAAGKSNLIKAIDCAIDIILRGIENVDLTKKYFRIIPENFNKPGVFQFEFIVNDTVYSYGFAISYNNEDIIDEWLYEITPSKEICIFSREKEDNQVIINSDLSFKKEDREDETNFEVYKKDIKRMNKSLFVAEIAKKQIDDSEFFKKFNEVYDWFKKVVIIFPNSKYGHLNKIASDENMREEFKTYLTYFDTGVENVLNTELDLDKALSDLDEQLKTELKTKLLKNLTEKPITVRGGNIMLSIYKKDDGEIVAQKMMLDHGNSLDLFEYNDESDGTKRLFDLIPIFFNKKSDAVIIIDEIDRSFHSRLTSEFVELFYRLSEGNKTQLIVTTHDPILMDLDKVRQDEVWFVERRKDHSTVIYSLDKFKARYDKKIDKDYLIGRYGGVPLFTSFPTISEADVN